MASGEELQTWWCLPRFERMGVTPHAELINGRMAMMGIITCVAYSGIQGQSMIDTINEWVGGAYF